MKSTWAFPDSPETPVVTSRGVYVRSPKSRATADLSALLFYEARGAKKSRLRRVSKSGVRDARHAVGIGNVFLADRNEIAPIEGSPYRPRPSVGDESSSSRQEDCFNISGCRGAVCGALDPGEIGEP